MLYVFYVDTGNMMTFDMNLALESVQNLKDTIERQYQMPATHQVLLVSGGEILKSNSRVCSYSAGTDTNPIFMFSTLEHNEFKQPQSCLNIEPDRDLQEQVDRCLNLPPTYDTVVARAHIAQKIHDIAKEEIRICEKLVHEQHLQQQGWAAVMANMEDLTEEFRQRSENFYRTFEDHLRQRCIYLDLLKNFNDDLAKLSKIPILPALMHNAEREFHGFDEFYEENDSFTSKVEANVTTSQKSTASKPSSVGGRESTPEELEAEVMEQTKARGLTLLQWISAKENQKSLQNMAQSCARGLGLFEEESMTSLRKEVLHAIDGAEKEEMREIKGLGARLSGLDEMMHKAKGFVEEQSELATAFKKNLNRASDLGDRSVLPDLCVSHRSQLIVMRKNHLSLRDIRRRISKAKEELGDNLYQRLRFVVYVENRMSDLDNKLLFYHRCLRRVQRHLVIIEQIHRAPSIYVSAITEVVRRRTFSSAFLKWASELACNLLIICNEEVMRRDEFTKIFDNHFLNTLFPGMDDMPPTFATESPSIFDASLPIISKSDINVLSTYMPEVTTEFQLPDLSAALEFFAMRCSNSKSQEKSSNSEDKPQDQSQPRSLDVISHLKEYERGFESETDTEEFEKVGQSPNDRRTLSTVAVTTSTSINTQILPAKPETVTISTSTDEIITHSIETLTEDNLGTTKLEVERLKNILSQLSGITRNSISLLRQQLDQMRAQTGEDRADFATRFQAITDSWEKVLRESDNKERTTIQQLTVDHELELNDIKKCLLERDEQIHMLQSAKSDMETSHVQELCQHEKDKSAMTQTVCDLTKKIKELEERIAAGDAIQEKAVNEMREKLVNEQKTEIESLRCRFKLMTNMERSPSDTSLEKIERIDVIEMAKHEAIVSNLKEELAQEKDALRAEREKPRGETVLMRSQQQLGTSTGSPQSFTASQDMFKRILEEKERQMDALNESNNVMRRENIKYKERIQALADSDINDSQIVTLKAQLELVQADKIKLEENLNMERSRYMGSSVSESRSITTDLVKTAEFTKRSKSHHQKSGISVESCSRGETVLVIWNTVHEQYVIAQEADILYFLHAESYEGLNLVAPSVNHPPQVMFRIGRVVDKEYCHAKKSSNRYKVQQGTKFYRVKIDPLPPSDGSEKHKRDRPTTLPVSHSSSSQMLIDSFAQTENIDDSIARDMVDSGVVAQQRNISITEEDEPISLDERCRYISVSEEDENILDTSQALSSSNQLQLPTETDLSEKDQDDSDEYRSLEAKDDLLFLEEQTNN